MKLPQVYYLYLNQNSSKGAGSVFLKMIILLRKRITYVKNKYISFILFCLSHRTVLWSKDDNLKLNYTSLFSQNIFFIWII